MVIKWNDKVNLVFTAGLADANYVCECIYIYIYIIILFVRKGVTKRGAMYLLMWDMNTRQHFSHAH